VLLGILGKIAVFPRKNGLFTIPTADGDPGNVRYQTIGFSCVAMAGPIGKKLASASDGDDPPFDDLAGGQWLLGCVLSRNLTVEDFAV
jgi:hypothetical protein